MAPKLAPNATHDVTKSTKSQPSREQDEFLKTSTSLTRDSHFSRVQGPTNTANVNQQRSKGPLKLKSIFASIFRQFFYRFGLHFWDPGASKMVSRVSEVLIFNKIIFFMPELTFSIFCNVLGCFGEPFREPKCCQTGFKIGKNERFLDRSWKGFGRPNGGHGCVRSARPGSTGRGRKGVNPAQGLTEGFGIFGQRGL